MGKVFISKCVFANFILVYITYVTSFIYYVPCWDNSAAF